MRPIAEMRSYNDNGCPALVGVDKSVPGNTSSSPDRVTLQGYSQSATSSVSSEFLRTLAHRSGNRRLPFIG